MKKNFPVEEKKEKPVTVASACRIFITRRATGRKEICQNHSILQVTARFDRALRKEDFEPYYYKSECENCVVLHIRRSLTEKNKEKSPKNGRERLTVIPRWVYEFIQPVINLSRTTLCFSNT